MASRALLGQIRVSRCLHRFATVRMLSCLLPHAPQPGERRGICTESQGSAGGHSRGPGRSKRLFTCHRAVRRGRPGSACHVWLAHCSVLACALLSVARTLLSVGSHTAQCWLAHCSVLACALLSVGHCEGDEAPAWHVLGFTRTRLPAAATSWGANSHWQTSPWWQPCSWWSLSVRLWLRILEHVSSSSRISLKSSRTCFHGETALCPSTSLQRAGSGGPAAASRCRSQARPDVLQERFSGLLLLCV